MYGTLSLASRADALAKMLYPESNPNVIKSLMGRIPENQRMQVQKGTTRYNLRRPKMSVLILVTCNEIVRIIKWTLATVAELVYA